ncbi:LysR substrate-binding domain-containing protein [Rudaea sp.]|uniref:LysR substrate-binding domain-containing protein n=1 Tax=Rudaea sp. TaxID=2136325 RepID=UPI00378421D2
MTKKLPPSRYPGGASIMPLKTRHLQLFAQLYEHRSVMHAATAANMTQPAASKLLAEMENLLGVPLFERHARGIEPTLYADALARRARSALSELERARDEIRMLRHGRLGQAAIGTVVNPGTNLVPKAIAAVKQAAPDILIRVEMDASRPLVAKLLEGRLDIVIGRIMDPELGADLEFEALADEPHAVIARAGHPLVGSRIRYEDLAGFGWIMPPDSSMLRARLGAVFLDHGMPWPQNVIETSALPVITALLGDADFLTTLPARSVAPYLTSGQLVVLPIDLGVRMDDFGIIRARHQRLSPAAERVLDALRKVARELYPEPTE